LVDDLVSLLSAWTQLSYLPMIIASHSLPPRSFLQSTRNHISYQI
jgi:hypothetical protein